MAPEHDENHWFRVVIDTDDADALSAILVDAFALGGTQIQDQSKRTTVIAYLERANFETADEIETSIHRAVDNSSLDASVTVVATEPFDDDNWETAWKEFFEPLSLSPRVRVGPPWESFEAPSNDGSGETAKIVLDPGMAFGTGSHETTRLSASLMDEWLAARPNSPEILDVGCGSGILSIAAIKLGAREAVGIDVETAAIEAARQNAAANDVADATHFSTTDVARLVEDFELVVANMLSRLLAEIREDLLNAVQPGGTLILSGMTVDELDEFTSTFAPNDWTIAETRERGDWAALRLTAPVA